MLLLMDAGNSYVKLAYHDGASWRDQQRIALPDFAVFTERLGRATKPDAIIIANVAADRFRLPMRTLLSIWGCPARWVTAEPDGYGIHNGYALAEQLGADRWAALIAARQLTPRSAVVASVGTAVTIDLLTEQGVFAGGLILPGLDMMRESLAEKTAGVGAAVGTYALRPTNTADAVFSGTLLAVAGAIDKALSTLPEQNSATELILTGGGAETIAPLLSTRPRVIPNLVLEGLLEIARAERML